LVGEARSEDVQERAFKERLKYVEWCEENSVSNWRHPKWHEVCAYAGWVAQNRTAGMALVALDAVEEHCRGD